MTRKCDFLTGWALGQVMSLTMDDFPACFLELFIKFKSCHIDLLLIYTCYYVLSTPLCSFLLDGFYSYYSKNFNFASIF